MNFKKLLALTFASLAMGNVASIAQITPIDQCNVKDMTMCGSDLYVATNEGYLIFDTKVGETKEMKPLATSRPSSPKTRPTSGISPIWA